MFLTLFSALRNVASFTKTECPLLTKFEYNITSTAPDEPSTCVCDKSTIRFNSGRDLLFRTMSICDERLLRAMVGAINRSLQATGV